MPWRTFRPLKTAITSISACAVERSNTPVLPRCVSSAMTTVGLNVTPAEPNGVAAMMDKDLQAEQRESARGKEAR